MNPRAGRADAAQPPSAPVDFAHAFDALHEGFFVGTFGPAGIDTLAANAHLRLMFGWPEQTAASDVRPLDPKRFTDEQSRLAFFDQLQRDGSTIGYLLRLRRIDGSAMWVEVTANLEGPSPARLEALVRDVTERKKLQDQARDLHDELLQAEKLASLGQTMSGVAHELNNPLATILACAERVAGHSLDETTKRDLEAIHNAAERAARIVRNLQTFAHKRHTTRTLVDVNQVVRDTLALRLYEQRAGNITILQALAAGLPHVFADPHQLQQVLLNLILNAEQAMLGAHGRGTLILRSWHDADEDAVRLEVADDGPGVPEKVQSKIFDPFFTTKPVGKGTGLGLAVAYAITQEHGGRISVSNAQGGGATFLLQLPAATNDPSRARRRASAPETAAATQAIPAGAKALVIEDERALGDAVAAALTDEGFTIERAFDGAEALERLRAGRYDVIICDVKMPVVDGISVFREITSEQPDIARRIVFVTGDVAGSDTEQFLAASGCRWLAKPFRLKDLVRAARQAL